ncbi:SUMF1/EgtB/PvdO family nonheme iron enzyme [Anaerolineales bacterium HSG6]|nr:SUMF1/EgtB/PvdO family nonheme iron enzyme [Anaerolineales bacterium HSG6]
MRNARSLTNIRIQVPHDDNPYVGPRTFEEDDSDVFFGRNREARDLLSLVIAEPVVLFYAQSGTGKSSIINTRLIPGLREENFYILPKARVSGDLPTNMPAVDNIFVFNLLLSLDQDRSKPENLADVTISKYLQVHKYELFMAEYFDEEEYFQTDPGIPLDDEDDEFEDDDYEEIEEPTRVLIIDQFEEIVTTHTQEWEAREAFFEQLGEAIENDPSLWVVLTMREDYIANLDPYAIYLPGKLRARFRLSPLKRDAALWAVTEPAKQGGAHFAEGVAESLVDNLRRVQAGESTYRKPGDNAHQMGAYIEPVHLQIVCRQLWANLPPNCNLIEAHHIQKFGDVDHALRGFYRNTISTVVRETDISERSLRTWVSTQLITPARTRSLVYRDQQETAGLSNEAINILHNAYIIRADIRGQNTWYELTHDRLVEPILSDNQEWKDKNQNPLNIAANAWLTYGKDPNKLYRGDQLREAKRLAKERPNDLSNLEKQFIIISLEAVRQQAKKRQQIFMGAATIIILLFSAITVYALYQTQTARREEAKVSTAVAVAQEQKAVALEQKTIAQAASTDAKTQEDVAINAKSTAEDRADSLATAQHEAVEAQQDAEEQKQTAEAASTLAIEQKNTAEAKQREAVEARAYQISNLEARLTVEAERSQAIVANMTAVAVIDTETPTPQTELETGTPVQENTPTSTATATPDLQTTATIEALEQQLSEARAKQTVEAVSALTRDMVRVPAGGFEMGFLPDTDNIFNLSVTPEADELPPRLVTLPEYWIDQTEVTNIAYRECVEVGVCQSQAGGNQLYHIDPTNNNYPVVNISWHDAKTYCEWLGKRLPTEAEWEKAARGTDGRVWAWGNILKDNLSRPVERANVKGGFFEGPTDIYSHQQSASPYGAVDMTGNVWEWVNDWYSPTYYDKRPNPDQNPLGPAKSNSEMKKVIRGGSFREFAVASRTDERNALVPKQRFPDVGFRCAVSPK